MRNRATIVKAVTVYQPWATLLVEGVKPWEFRPWDVPTWIVGQRIVIHAGKREMLWDEVGALREACLRQDPSSGIGAGCFEKALEILARPLASFPLMAAIGDVRLGSGQLLQAKVIYPDGNEDKAKYAWSILDPRLWPAPVLIKGAQGFWDYPHLLPPRATSPSIENTNLERTIAS